MSSKSRKNALHKCFCFFDLYGLIVGAADADADDVAAAADVERSVDLRAGPKGFVA